MEPLSPVQQQFLTAIQGVSPGYSEDQFRKWIQEDPTHYQSAFGDWRTKQMSSGTDQFVQLQPGQEKGPAMLGAWLRNMAMTPVNAGIGLAHAVAHPIQTAQNTVGKASSDVYNLLYGQMTPEQQAAVNAMSPVPYTPESRGRAALGLAGDALMATGNPLAMGAGAAANAPNAQSAGAAMLTGYGLPELANAPGAVLNRMASGRVADLASSVPGGAEQLVARAREFSPLVPKTMQPTVADLGGGPSYGIYQATGAQPSIRAWWEGQLQKRTAPSLLTSKGTVRPIGATIPEAIRTQAALDFDPEYEDFERDAGSFNGTGGITVRQAHNAPIGSPENQAYLNALKGGWKPGSDLDATVPGTQHELLSDPNVIKASKSSHVPEDFPDIEKGETITIGQAFTLKKALDQMTDDAFARKDGDVGASYQKSRNALDQAIRNQSEKYVDLQARYADRMAAADRAETILGPGIKLGGYGAEPYVPNVGMYNPAGKTGGRFLQGALDKLLASRMSDMLATPATPEAVTDLLHTLPTRRAYNPALQNRGGFVNFGNNGQELPPSGAPYTDKFGNRIPASAYNLTPEELAKRALIEANLRKMGMNITPGPVSGLTP